MERAANTVLGTVELLEKILLHLDPKTVFVLQRVSVMWRNTINQSIHIKRMIFVVADGSVVRPVSMLSVSRLPAVPVYAPDVFTRNNWFVVFNASTKFLRSSGLLMETRGHFRGGGRIDIDAKGNPDGVRFSQANAVTIARDKTNRLYGDLLGSGVFRCRNASWRRILLTQPPCTSVLMEIEVSPLARYTGQVASFKRDRTVRSHGITLGDLLNGMQELVLDIWKANGRLRHTTDFDTFMTWSVSEECPADEVRDRAEEDWDTNDEDWAANSW
ncbi:hypothetical protein W97_02710 [Coniosporium apollinis CBS 100218]|uniref:F-box domain-containing protein n=1 Tax=Coniosporium apollinis (strain CBS 100218) TaxID=1168221 RepID=R7YNL1_CONA1|nr:uncharacterized protein W97_02710 [Coniosporium apollinis CBS 100218]EON63482.1 hypothetical protein W97_02710 [Coniosporium apollinis CBS 100218]